MIVSCPACAARFRLDRKRLDGKRISLRCSRCRTVFKVKIPAVASSPPRLRVVVAHGDPALCGTIREILQEEGMECGICYDATTLLERLETLSPQIAIIDVALPGRYIFELVETIRSRPNLTATGIILLSSVYNRTAYKRTPSSLYGADDYIEKHHLPDDLLPKIYALASKALPAATAREAVVPGLPVGSPADGSGNRENLQTQIRAAEDEEFAVGSEAVDKAKRLARIIIADIALYSQDKIEAGLRQGNIRALLAPDLEEGKRLFAERIAPAIRSRGDFLEEALVEFLKHQQGRASELKGLV